MRRLSDADDANTRGPQGSNDGVDISVECLKCHAANTVASKSMAMICSNCRTVNRVHHLPRGSVVKSETATGDAAETGSRKSSSVSRRLSIVDFENPTSNPVSLPNSPDVYQLSDGPVQSFSGDGSSTSIKAEELCVCSVCVENPGDMVLLPCNHGGLCDACARHIAFNNAVGGTHCPKCRSSIHGLLRIGEINKDSIRCITIPIEDAMTKNPPRVPTLIGGKKERSSMKMSNRSAARSSKSNSEGNPFGVDDTANSSHKFSDVGVSDVQHSS